MCVCERLQVDWWLDFTTGWLQDCLAKRTPPPGPPISPGPGGLRLPGFCCSNQPLTRCQQTHSRASTHLLLSLQNTFFFFLSLSLSVFLFFFFKAVDDSRGEETIGFVQKMPQYETLLSKRCTFHWEISPIYLMFSDLLVATRHVLDPGEDSSTAKKVHLLF